MHSRLTQSLHTTPQTSDVIPNNTNYNYYLNRKVTAQTDIPEAGNEVMVIKIVPLGSIFGLYLNHPNLLRVTKVRVCDAHNTCVYAVRFLYGRML